MTRSCQHGSAAPATVEEDDRSLFASCEEVNRHLADDRDELAYREKHQAKLDRLLAEGRPTREHLPEATAKARRTSRTPRTASVPRELLPPEPKRAGGRDADRVRDYQR